MNAPTVPSGIPKKPSAEHAKLIARLERVVKDFKVVSLHETHVEDRMSICNEPEVCAKYWREIIAASPHYNREVESFYVLMLNTRRHPKGHTLVAQGTLDTILVHPREVFRAAVIAGASAIVLMHNHPSGDPTPSEGDIVATRTMIRAGTLLKIEVLDHIIIGRAAPCRARDYSSLRELGYFYELDSSQGINRPPTERAAKPTASRKLAREAKAKRAREAVAA